AVTRAKNAQWGLCQPETALAINAAARAVVTAGPLVEELVAGEAWVLTFSGQPERALGVLEHMEGTDGRTRVVRAIAAAPALAVTGQTAAAVKAAEAGYADHLALGEELAIAHPAMHLVNQVFALAEAGRLADAERLATEGAEIVAAYRLPLAQIFFAPKPGRVGPPPAPPAAGGRAAPPLLRRGGRAGAGAPLRRAAPPGPIWPGPGARDARRGGCRRAGADRARHRTRF